MRFVPHRHVILEVEVIKPYRGATMSRSIFRWITAKDLNKLQFADNLDSDTPMGLLRGIKLGVESYHNLFKRLCSYAGLHCEIIEGYSKGAGYKPGSRIRGNAFRNQWTAVFIDGAWRFVNCNWGARHVKGPRDERMTYKCDEFYFLTDPEDHIYQHFPDDPDWQLLPKPISLDQFVKLPLLKSPFFNKHLALASEYESVIHSSEGGDEVRIISPSSLCFGAQLKSKDGDVKPEMLQDRMLVRRLGEEIIFLTKLPSAGKYFLEIYCGDSVDADSMDNVCSFRICCYSVLPNTHISFPPASCFGRTPAFASFDIKEETHSDPYVIQSGQLLIAFICQSNLKLSHSLTLWNHRDRKLEEYDRYAFAVHRSEHMVSYAIHCPKRGGYVFSMFASDEQRVDPKCIYRYYIECSSPTENTFPLPKASKRWQHCRLIDPLNGNLPLRSRVRFRIESAVAVEIVVNVNGTWHGLHKSGNMWQGSVNTGENRTKLSVYGRFDKSKEKYVPLLEYQVKGTR
ncbi:hypothetical protein LSH36_61g07055 [Paralvinella palmiformis]|uniref:Transglutaminase-like domain-containing protein n=1 Tax=Paralvinella palmiformis TaxID=53620 RepID=A0AAD9K4K4_9ANNE|nr:hypothetical protein LSH36_61g07055 [Paralvinella palmiformis]